jgi:hypothetical protein
MLWVSSTGVTAQLLQAASCLLLLLLFSSVVAGAEY